MNQVVEKDFYQENFSPEVLDLFKTESGEPYLTFNGDNIRIVSAEFKELLWKQHFLKYGQEPSCCKVNQAIKTLYMYGRTLAPIKAVNRRFAKSGGAIFIDVGTPDGARVKITGESAGVEYNSEVKFIRSKAQRSIGLPAPEAKPEHLELLKRYIPFKGEDDFILSVSWLLGCLNVDGGYPVFFLVGEQGAGKSTTCRLLKDLLDPSSAMLRNFPKTEKELMIAATNDFILCFDNTSKITDIQSDNLCKLALGTVFTTRRLFSTVAEVQLSSKNPCMINGIDCLPERQDLLDRSLIVSLAFIPPEKRKTDRELMESWEHDRPLILGALCQAASAGLRNYDSVSERNLPRMADFAKWVIAAEENLPWEKGQFMKTMKDLRNKIIEEALDADPVAMAVLRLMEHRDRWIGSATELLDVLETYIDQDRRRYPGFPKIHNQLSHQLSRVSAFLREQGVQVEKGHSGKRFIEITNIPLKAANQARKQAKMDAEKAAVNKVTGGFASVTQAQNAGEETEDQAPENKAHDETNTAFAEDFDI